MQQLIAFAVFLFIAVGCSTTGTTGERAAAATVTTAIGGGFVATGAVTALGGAAGAAYVTSLPPSVQGDLPIFMLIPVGVGVVEVVAGGLLLKNGSEELAIAIDTARFEEKVRLERALRMRDEAARQRAVKRKNPAETAVPQPCTPGWDCPVDES